MEKTNNKSKQFLEKFGFAMGFRRATLSILMDLTIKNISF